MRRTYAIAVLLVILLMTLLAACGRSSKAPSDEEGTTLEQIRKQAALAFDGTASSAQREAAADEATRLLKAFLATPESLSVTDEEWARSPRPGVETMVRHVELGASDHLYALSLPADRLVDRREVIFFQRRRAGQNPVVQEVTTPEDTFLLAARSFADGSRRMLTLALGMEEGGGYLAHYEEKADGRLVPDGSSLRTVAGTYGDIRLVASGDFLEVVTRRDTPWEPVFDPEKPLRLVLAPALALEWDGGFVLADDSRFDAFALLAIAEEPARCTSRENCPSAILELKEKAPEQVAPQAWAMATEKLTALLAEESSWVDDFAGRLPQGARSIREEGVDLSARVLAVPAPKGVEAGPYTAVQVRVHGGLPMVRAVELPGLVREYRVMSHQGYPALFLVLEEGAAADAQQRTLGLHLLRMTADNNWVAAQGWIGKIPDAPHWSIRRPAEDQLLIQWDLATSPNLTVSLSGGPSPAVSICRLANMCHRLTWVSGRLHSLDILQAQMAEAKQSLPEDQILWRASQLAEFLQLVDPVEFTAAELKRMLDPAGTLDMDVLDLGSGTRLVTMPPNPTGFQAAVLHAAGQGLVVSSADGFITEWEGGRIYLGGSEYRLLLLGRSKKAVVLLAFAWDGSRWVQVDPLTEAVDENLFQFSRLMHTPGQTRPVRGMIILTDGRLRTQFAAEGVRFCEGLFCRTYGYKDGWGLYSS